MYDCLTAQEESQLFLKAMDEFEKSIDCFDEEHEGLPPHVYTENEVKNNRNNGATPDQPIFFIAGRGGETNFHAGNAIFRNKVLQFTQSYIQAGTKGRGKKFARALMREPRCICDNFIFVVRQTYFRKNVEGGKISSARKNSVLAKHAPRTLNDLLRDEDPSHYLAIGEDWVVGIITDLLRTSASKFMASSSPPSSPRPCSYQPPQQQQQHTSATFMMMPMLATSSKRKHTPPPRPEISIPGEGGAVPCTSSTMPPYYQYQQQPQHSHQQPQHFQHQHQQELSQHHDDCSLSSASDNDEDDEDHSMHSKHSGCCRGSVASASNDMFLSPGMMQPPLPPPMTMLMPQQPQKKARMTVMTTMIPVASILPQQQTDDNQQSWYAASPQAIMPHPVASTFVQQPQQPSWEHPVVTPPMATQNNYQPQPLQQQQQQPIPQAYSAGYYDDGDGDGDDKTSPWNTAAV